MAGRCGGERVTQSCEPVTGVGDVIAASRAAPRCRLGAAGLAAGPLSRGGVAAARPDPTRSAPPALGRGRWSPHRAPCSRAASEGRRAAGCPPSRPGGASSGHPRVPGRAGPGGGGAPGLRRGAACP